MAIGYAIFGSQSYYRVQTDESTTLSPNAKYNVTLKHGFYAPYFVSPTAWYGEVWLRDNQSPAQSVKVFDQDASITWIDNNHLRLVVSDAVPPSVTLHNALGVTITYHIGKDALDGTVRPRVEQRLANDPLHGGEVNRAYTKFRAWARVNADNPDEEP